MPGLSRRRSNVPDVWPGFVDALATLVMVVVFVLMVFTIFQFYLKDVISGRDEALNRLNTELGQINALLATERGASADLRSQLATSSTALGEANRALGDANDARARLRDELAASIAVRARLNAELNTTRERVEGAEQAAEEARTRAEGAEQQGARSAADLEAARQAIAESERTIAADRERIELQLRDLTALRTNVEQLAALRRELEGRVTALADELGTTRTRAESAEQQGTRSVAELAAAREAIAEAERQTTVDREHIEMQVQQLASLRRSVEDLATLRRDLEARVAALDLQVEQRQAELGQTQQALTQERTESERGRQLGAALQSDLTRVRAALATQIEELRLMRIALDAERVEIERRRGAEQDLARQVDGLRTQLMSATGEADDARRALGEAQRRRQEGEQRAATLDQDVAGLRTELARLNALLGTDQQQIAAQSATITDLNTRLNAALASRVEELTRYRSEFFGRLRAVFEGRSGIRVEGDRFILESEVLFSVGSADLGVGGFEQLDRIAETMRDLMGQIPPEVPWVLQVEGHTDRRPVVGRFFRSNWELSTARAISVMRYLVDRGVPPDRIAVAGYGEFRPIDRGDTEAAFARNRRIELRFTSR
jgi:chemotaxis protein MotB